MIKKISKLKNFGIFQDFSWVTEVPPFKKFNLIYGWNRSGKTTISRVFASCEKKCTYDPIKFRQYPESGEFDIETTSNEIIKNSNVDSNSLSIRVFNQDFIDDNISFDPSSSCNPIVYISEEDIESKNKLEELKTQKPILGTSLAEATKERIVKEGIKESFLTGLGREIANTLFDKSYNRTKAELKINSIGIDNFSDKKLSDTERKKYELVSKSDPEKTLPLISKLDPIDFDNLLIRVKHLLDKKIISQLLERLKDPSDKDGGLDEELNDWVKKGLDLHKSKNQFKKCLFCENNIDNNLFDSLAKHFSKDYEELQEFIRILILELQGKKITSISEKNFELYSDLRAEYENKAKQFNEIVEKENNWLIGSEALLEQKYKNPFDPDIPKIVDQPENYTDLLNNVVVELNNIISSHNERVKNYTKEVQNAKEKLELNLISVAFSKEDYKKMNKDITDAKTKEQEMQKKVNENNSEIENLEKKTSNIGKAINDINKYLNEFFGGEEIKLELDTSKKGYVINRNKQPAKNLSEGEKTAIAFSYFIVKMGESSFDKTNGIIFIDDPISSFDSNFIYHCFSLITNSFNEIGQLFLSTHNFQFFNLSKEWLIKKNNRISKDNEKLRNNNQPEKPYLSEFFMVENYQQSDIRKARLVKLDKTLLNFKSEYHFLFAKLKEFSEKVDVQYEDFYTIGNMARRFYDIFADFKIPTNDDQKSKLDMLLKDINEDKERISREDAEKTYKLINEFSHNSDPTSAIEHKDKEESKNAVKILLKIIEASDPKHYSKLSDNLS